MATLTQQDRKRIADKLKVIQDKLNQIKSLREGQVAGASTTSGLNAAQEGGARGVGLETPEVQEEIAKETESTLEAGGSVSQVGNNISRQQASDFIKKSGLEGILDPNQFTGQKFGQATAAIARERAKRFGQVSANTSFAFNPETLKRTQRAIDKFGFALDEVDNDPFEPKEFKDQNRENAIKNAEREIANLFNSQEDFLNATNANPAFQATLKKFTDKGGTVEGIAKNISAPATGGNVQDQASYIAGLSNPNANTEAERLAIEELAPESEIAQAEIARVSRIPEDLKRLYFGDEKTIGILEMRQNQAQEEIRIIEEQERDAKRTARERAALQVDKNKAEVKVQKAKIEENRLRAKNYMTAQLAKLGALKTTGAAPLALQTLDTKYDQQVTQLTTTYDFASREIEIGLDESLDAIENQTDENILEIQEDLTLDSEKMTKAVLAEQQKAEKEVYRITEQYARRLRERTTKYTSDLKKAAEKYAKEYAKTVSGIDTDGISAAVKSGKYEEGQYVPDKGVLLPTGKFDELDLTPSQEREVDSANLRGANTIKFFVSRSNPFKQRVIEEAQVNGRKFSSLQSLKALYDQWMSEQEEDKNDDFEGF